jgi:hypothetical protein
MVYKIWTAPYLPCSNTLPTLDPCDGVECGFMQECVNVKGRGICTCDYDCDETYNPVCSDQITFSRLVFIIFRLFRSQELMFTLL